MSKIFSPKIATDGLVMCLDASQNKSYPAIDLPIKNGLNLWLDASDDTTFSYSSGTAVSQWRDKSGNNFHASQGTVASQPSRSTTQNSRKTVNFDGVNDTVTIPNFSCNSEMSIFVVSNCGTSLLIEHSTDTNNNQGFYFYGGGNGMIYITRSTGTLIFNTNWLSGGYSIASAVNSTGLDLLTYKNGTQQTITTDSRSTVVNSYVTTTLYIGSRGANSLWSSGPIAEIIIYNRKVTNTERNLIHTYLGQKWGISNTDRSIIDMSGGGYAGLLGNGTTANMPFYDYYNKGALKFDGTDDYIVNTVPSIAASSTIGLWIKCASYNNKIPISIAGAIYGSGPNIFFYNSTINWNIGDGGGNPFTNSYYPDSNWHYIVVTNDAATNAKLYIDGVLIGTAAYRNTTSTNSNNFWIGRFSGDNNYTINANIAATQLYNRVLSAAEVAQNYEAQKSKFANTIVQQGLVLNLDAGNPYSYAGAGTTWYDVSGNGYNGILTNGPTYSSDNAGIIVFDGANDYSLTTFASSANLINDPTTNGGIISFSIWVNVISNTNGGYIISSGGETSSTGFWMANQNGSPEVGIKTTSKVWYALIPSSDFPLNTWINWSVICNNTNMFIYKNGIIYSTNSSAGVSVSSQYSRLAIGTPAAVLGSYCGNNKVSNVLIYNIALSAAQVLQNYNATKSRYGL